jgi:hypothetical protein
VLPTLLSSAEKMDDFRRFPFERKINRRKRKKPHYTYKYTASHVELKWGLPTEL